MIYLKPLSISNLASFYPWINDKTVIRYSMSIFQNMKTKEAVLNWLKTILSDQKNLNLGIFTKEGDKCIGYAGISKISNYNRSGEYFIFIGDKAMWGKGISTYVTKEIVRLGFETLDLNRIMLTVSVPNVGGLRSYQNAGFRQEGIMREAAYRDNEYHDKVLMSILKKEWKEEQ